MGDHWCGYKFEESVLFFFLDLLLYNMDVLPIMDFPNIFGSYIFGRVGVVC